jgi:hypothetical protein
MEYLPTKCFIENTNLITTVSVGAVLTISLFINVINCCRSKKQKQKPLLEEVELKRITIPVNSTTRITRGKYVPSEYARRIYGKLRPNAVNIT